MRYNHQMSSTCFDAPQFKIVMNIVIKNLKSMKTNEIANLYFKGKIFYRYFI